MRFLTVVLLPLRVILVVLLSPVITVIYASLVFLVAIPSHFFRKLVSLIGRLLDRDLSKLVTATATVSGRDFADWYTQPSQSVCTVLKFSGNIDLEALQKLVLNKLVYRRNPKGGHLEYPELQQYCTKRLGYLFYKWDRNFDIKNHVMFYHSKKLLPDPRKDLVDDERLMEIWEDCVRQPYQPKQSPWQILLIPNYIRGTGKEAESSPEKGEAGSVFILKQEHSLMDGISVYRVLLALTDQGLDIWEKQIRSRIVPKCFSTMLHLKGLFLGPTHFLWKCLKGVDAYHALHMPLRKKTGQTFLGTTTLDLEFVKKICRVHLDVSFHAVLLAGIAGGMRTYLKRNGLKIPYSPIRLGIPIPRPGHSEKLRGEFLTSCVELPVQKKTARERLFACEKGLIELKTGALMPMLTQAITLIGGLPVEWARFLTSTAGASVVYSEMKGPAVQLTFMNGEHNLEDLRYSVPVGSDDAGISFSSLSYNGKIHFVLGVDKSIARNREKCQELLSCIEKEIVELQYGDSTNL